jgi:phosphoglucosamine mutase
MTVSGSGLAALAAAIPMLPQQQRAIRVRHRDQWENDDVLRQAIGDAEARLAPDGRILVRPSGTEPVLRVMVEGRDASEVAVIADAIAALAGERLH